MFIHISPQLLEEFIIAYFDQNPISQVRKFMAQDRLKSFKMLLASGSYSSELLSQLSLGSGIALKYKICWQFKYLKCQEDLYGNMWLDSKACHPATLSHTNPLDIYDI